MATFATKADAIRALLDANPRLEEFFERESGWSDFEFNRWMRAGRVGPKPSGYANEGRLDAISVRHHHYSMGSHLYVYVKDASVKLSMVEAIAGQHERIDRDQWGEILSGGNRFLTVEYTNEALAPIVAELAPLFAALQPDGREIAIRDGEYRAFRPMGGADYTYVIDRNGKQLIRCWHGPDGSSAARQLAQRIADPPAPDVDSEVQPR